jgi:hypothetical protein
MVGCMAKLEIVIVKKPDRLHILMNKLPVQRQVSVFSGK